MRSLSLRQIVLIAAFAVPVSTSFQASAQAQAWPAKPVHIVVAAAAGGGTDMLARIVANRLTENLKQSFVVDNKGGANGLIASEAVARSPADGYTLLFSYTAAMLVNPALHPNSSSDPLKDFEPVAQVGSTGNLLVVSPDLPVHDLKQLVSYVREHKDAASYGSWGTGSGGHLVMETLLQRAGLKMTHVPYKGVAPLATDVIGGTIKIAWVDTSSQVQNVKAGKMRAIAVSGSTRLPQLLDVPTTTQQGYPFDTDAWYGLFAPARTPPQVIARLNAEIANITSMPDVQAQMVAMNLANPAAQTPAQFRERIAKEGLIWRSAINAAGIKPQ